MEATPPPDIFWGGVSSLADQLDKRVLLVLRDGRHLIGTLTSYDQYGSLVLENTYERIFAAGKYADARMGLYLIRGENVVLLGEVDPSREGNGKSGPALVEAPYEEVRELDDAVKAAKEAARSSPAAAATAQANGWAMLGAE